MNISLLSTKLHVSTKDITQVVCTGYKGNLLINHYEENSCTIKELVRELEKHPDPYPELTGFKRKKSNISGVMFNIQLCIETYPECVGFHIQMFLDSKSNPN